MILYSVDLLMRVIEFYDAACKLGHA